MAELSRSLLPYPLAVIDFRCAQPHSELDRPSRGGIDAALVQHALGDDEFALEALEQMYTENPNGLQYLNCDFYWADLRSHPRVQAILQKLNLVK